MCHILPPQTGISERVELQPHRNPALWHQTALFHDYFDGDCQDNGDDAVRIQKMHGKSRKKTTFRMTKWKTFRKQNPWIIALAIWIRAELQSLLLFGFESNILHACRNYGLILQLSFTIDHQVRESVPIIIIIIITIIIIIIIRCESLCRSSAWRRSFLQSTSPTAFQAWEGDCFQRTQ